MSDWAEDLRAGIRSYACCLFTDKQGSNALNSVPHPSSSMPQQHECQYGFGSIATRRFLWASDHPVACWAMIGFLEPLALSVC